MLVPAFRLDKPRYALTFPILVRLTPIAEGEAIDVGEPLVITELDDPPEHGDGAIPVLQIEHRDGYPRITSYVGQPQPLEVHVDEDAAPFPVVPRRSRIGSPVRANRGNNSSLRLL